MRLRAATQPQSGACGNEHKRQSGACNRTHRWNSQIYAAKGVVLPFSGSRFPEFNGSRFPELRWCSTNPLSSLWRPMAAKLRGHECFAAKNFADAIRYYSQVTIPTPRPAKIPSSSPTAHTAPSRPPATAPSLAANDSLRVARHANSFARMLTRSLNQPCEGKLLALMQRPAHALTRTRRLRRSHPRLG